VGHKKAHGISFATNRNNINEPGYVKEMPLNRNSDNEPGYVKKERIFNRRPMLDMEKTTRDMNVRVRGNDSVGCHVFK
jgi:hypothetical protein